LLGNLESTEVSGIAEVVAAREASTRGVAGYVSHEYEVVVLDHFVGRREERMLLSQAAETGAKLRPVGSTLFFSGCSKTPGRAFEPDVGYFIFIPASCRAHVRDLAARLAKGAKPSSASAAPSSSACSE
jgi:hypothetical protein